MYLNKEQLESHLDSGDNVLDIGSWNDVFPRANWIIDINPYESRRNHTDSNECFDKSTWLQSDINDRGVWERFGDKEFDFAICSHVLEDIRDPLFVCEQLIRVAKRGYIEVPTRYRECARATPEDTVSGYDHHRWLVEVVDGKLVFTPKLHWAHVLDYLTDARREYLNNHKFHYFGFFWDGRFSYRENCPKGEHLEAANIMYLYDTLQLTQLDECITLNAHKSDVDDINGHMLWVDQFELAIERAGVDVVHSYIDAYKKLRVTQMRTAAMWAECLTVEQTRVAVAERMLDEARRSTDVASKELESIYQSKSWRVTSPLRALVRRVYQLIEASANRNLDDTSMKGER